jgi:predicted ribosome quality control (RQC) complex YloA/Tae2 family protein
MIHSKRNGVAIMALDGIVIHALVHELQACVGGRINKIHQPSGHDLIFMIRAQGKNYKLLLSANPTYPRLHLTDEQFTNPMEPPMFCMLMRKYCESGIVEAIEQVGMERIIHLTVRNRNELGDVQSKTIIVEIMGRHSNIILLNPETNQVMDGIHHVTPAISAYRSILPGSIYAAPPEQGKQNPLEWLNTNSGFELNNIMLTGEEAQHLRPEQQLVKAFEGLSPLVAKEIVYRHEMQPDTTPNGLYRCFTEVFNAVKNHQYTPMIKSRFQDKSYFSVVELKHITGEEERFETASQMLEAYYSNKAERDAVKQRGSDLIKHLQNEKNKNVKKLDKLSNTLEDSKTADQQRILGELVTAHLYQITRGDKVVEVVNYYDEDQAVIQIALDPQLTPSENAQRYFKKYTKLKNSAAAVKEQLQQTEEEIRYLDTLLQQLESAGLADIDEIREELIEQGYLRDRGKGKKKKKSKHPALNCYMSSEGIPIYVGKNNMQNEYLTNRFAKSSDTWLHTKDIPGSHVVINSQEFGEATLEEAAQIAAYFSKAKESSQVPVDYTFIRHVRKPSGAKPGYVIYDSQKTLFITPDERRIQALEHSVKS